ncbi:MAG: capsule biosynthesis protein CapK [Bacteroidaceae bacterium]|nr:capsule biosynthesis protein CapK [Bacteroidaceae bacterium]
MNDKIDFVVTWLDSSDPEWQKQYCNFKGVVESGDQSSARFRDWDLFKYWFRSVEAYAPWVNKVFLVTNGTFPKWINPNHTKLKLVRHVDYIPERFLPTFNSCTIELHMNKIEGLSDQFVYFNDDCYINAPISPDYYFKEGLPCDNNAETFFNVPVYDSINRFTIYPSMMADIGVLNAHFDRREVCKQSPMRWYGKHLGKVGLLNSLYMLMYSKKSKGHFVGFNWKHVEQPFLKSVFEEIWEKEPEILEDSCTRFREDVILNPYIFRYWQFASNLFYPVKLDKTRKYRIEKKHMTKILATIMNPNVKSLCINDTPVCTDEEFLIYKRTIHEVFNKKFPQKSSYEL